MSFQTKVKITILSSGLKHLGNRRYFYLDMKKNRYREKSKGSCRRCSGNLDHELNCIFFQSLAKRLSIYTYDVEFLELTWLLRATHNNIQTIDRIVKNAVVIAYLWSSRFSARLNVLKQSVQIIDRSGFNLETTIVYNLEYPALS